MLTRLSSAAEIPKASAIAAVAVAHRAALADRVVTFGRGENVAYPAARPERRAVVAGLVGVRAAYPEAVTAGIDQARVSLTQRVRVEAQPVQRSGRRLVRKTSAVASNSCSTANPVLVAKVQRDRALAPVRQRHREIDAVAIGADTLGRQAPVRVAVEALDADDVGAPVGQQRSGHRHKHPLGQLDDAYSIEHA